ncbi:MAG: hypothetical protein JWP88_951 [Flaviaesturariibacter sp.]|nr:hypothetical protein [Flaviaesturariibacter sp.]
MNEQDFLRVISAKSSQLGINPFLLLSGIEGLYTFKDVPLNTINYKFLDSLILTIFALRIGDQFHTLAQENLASPKESVQVAAAYELQPMSADEIDQSSNPYIRSFAQLLNGKSPVRRYHAKALEAAATEINTTLLQANSDSISSLVIGICKSELQNDLDLGSLFSSQ